MAVNADLSKLLDRDYEDVNLEDLVKAPVQALAGVSESDAELLKKAFNIKTVGDMGRNKFFRAATAIVDLAESKK
ncbi:hypothetical protein [Sphaerimonospora mesophila]|uniref:hypothetical protein n=1 Tax=Sphaerimonospora mesophila TaxID=37483 RepID=UPI0006E3B9A1